MDTKRIKTKFTKGLKAAFFIGFISFFIFLSGRADTPCTPVSAHGEELNIKSLDAFTVPRKKQTILNLYLTANKAYDIWKKNPGKITMIDTRTQGEYIFVGHPAMAYNIPVEFLQSKKLFGYEMRRNKNFVSDVQEKLKKNDIIFVICRSGNRSVTAVNLLARAGFKKAYSVIDGVEGDKLRYPASIDNGKRVVNGWKNFKLPWTYHLNSKLIYHP